MTDPIQGAILKEIDDFRETVVVGTSGFTKAHRQILSEAVQEHCRKLLRLDSIIERNLKRDEQANYVINQILSSGTLGEL